MQTCNGCQHWTEHTEEEKINYGFCRRYAPRPTVCAIVDGMTYQIIWPSTGKDDTCGEFCQRHHC